MEWAKLGAEISWARHMILICWTGALDIYPLPALTRNRPLHKPCIVDQPGRRIVEIQAKTKCSGSSFARKTLLRCLAYRNPLTSFILPALDLSRATRFSSRHQANRQQLLWRKRPREPCIFVVLRPGPQDSLTRRRTRMFEVWCPSYGQDSWVDLVLVGTSLSLLFFW